MKREFLLVLENFEVPELNIEEETYTQRNIELLENLIKSNKFD